MIACFWLFLRLGLLWGVERHGGDRMCAVEEGELKFQEVGSFALRNL
jgi:hypothetical protein